MHEKISIGAFSKKIKKGRKMKNKYETKKDYIFNVIHTSIVDGGETLIVMPKNEFTYTPKGDNDHIGRAFGYTFINSEGLFRKPNSYEQELIKEALFNTWY